MTKCFWACKFIGQYLSHAILLQVGLIAINPLDQSPKIKLYRDESGALKGDGSICYNSEVSVQMAVDILNEGYIRPSHMVTVSKATYEAQSAGNQGGSITGEGNNAKAKKPKMSHAQVKVAMSAMRQALSWAEDDDSGIAKSQALKIVVLQHVFTPSDFEQPGFEEELEEDISSECYKCGNIEKITLFEKNPLGVIIVKFSTSFAAQECIKLMNGRWYGGRQLKCFFWDGTTDYGAVVSSEQLKQKEKEEEARLEEFGDWIENEELPDEFQLRVEK
jgi:HIV Tat-specific factor 1